MNTLHDTFNNLEAKARKATPGKRYVGGSSSLGRHIFTDRNGRETIAIIYHDEDALHFAACSPDTVLSLITALREAESILSHIESECLVKLSNQDEARNWLAKYANGAG